MSMQLFSFGHPCEHQLHRACIGGSNCPLNGYPDTWCCSFIKGKINFKRDRPCEGPRCHWDFVHPTQAQFDEVTQVLEQSRPIAAKLDEAKDTDLLTFQISNPHITDTVQCALHMMRHPPSTCARRVGQLLAYAAVLAGDQDVFVQLLKTMKKPVDGYILGAYAYLTQSKAGGAGGGGEKGAAHQKGNNKKQAKRKDGKDDVSATLANIMVELMNAALSLGGQLVDREDQHVLQAMLIKALSTYPKNDKRHQEMLERAIAKFGNRKLDDEEEAAAKREAARREAAAAAAAAAAATPPSTKDLSSIATTPATTTASAPANTTTTLAGAEGGEASGAPVVAAEEATAAPSTSSTAERTSTTPSGPTGTTAVSGAAAAPLAGNTASTTDGAVATGGAAAASTESRGTAAVPTPAVRPAEVEATRGTAAAPPASFTAERRTPREGREEVLVGAAPPCAAATTPNNTFSSAPGTPSMAAAVATGLSGPFNSPPLFITPVNTAPTPTLTSAAAPGGTAAGRTPSQVAATLATTNTQTAAAATTATLSAAQASAGPVVGISRARQVLLGLSDRYEEPRRWSAPDLEGPVADLYLCGGQFTVKSHLWGSTPLGEAAPEPLMDIATKKLVTYIHEMREIEKQNAAKAEAEEARKQEGVQDACPRSYASCVDSDSWIYHHVDFSETSEELYREGSSYSDYSD
jgi:hypothetical protein